MNVVGPTEMHVSAEPCVCTVCGKNLHMGDTLYIGRAQGQHIRACSMPCFKKCVKAIKAEKPDVPAI